MNILIRGTSLPPFTPSGARVVAESTEHLEGAALERLRAAWVQLNQAVEDLRRLGGHCTTIRLALLARDQVHAAAITLRAQEARR